MVRSRGLVRLTQWALVSLLASGLASAQEVPETAEGDVGIDFAPDDVGVTGPLAQAPTSTPAEAPAAEGAAAEASPAPRLAVEDTVPKIRVRGKRNPDSIFGNYRVRVGMARPNFDQGLKGYQELYGDPEWYPTLSADWFAWDWYATLGISFRGGYYTASGHAAKAVAGKAAGDIDSSEIVKDENGPTSLTLLPLQVAFTAEMTPFARKWLVIDGWIGLERLYFQEVRSSSSGDEAQASIRFATADSQEDSSDDALTNKGWKNGTVVGVSANILLNPLDEDAAASMRGSMGLGFIYLSPFMEIVRTTSDKADFGRTTYGLGFTFETTH